MPSKKEESVPQWKKDGKQLEGSTAASLLMIALFPLAVPLWLVTVLPVSILAHIVLAITKKKVVVRHKPAEADERVAIAPGTLIPREKRAYDIVLLGTTGFTGRLAAKYLAKQYGPSGSKIAWAIAGRRQAALDDIKKELGLPDLPTILCDTANEGNVKELVKDTRVVISTAGPFHLHAPPVVKYCANYGTHYCDITGEVEWVSEVVDRYDSMCKETGARLVHCCGNDSVPWEILTMLCAEKLRNEHGCELTSVHLYDRMSGGLSGGTFATIFASMAMTSKYVPSTSFSPLLLTHKHEKSDSDIKDAVVMSVGYAAEEKSWLSLFVLAAANREVVRRSNALNNYGRSVVYREGRVSKNLPCAIAEVLGLLYFGMLLVCPPITWLLRKFVLPKPGEGPSEQRMEAAWLEVTAHAQGSGRRGDAKVKGTIYFKDDPFYRDTARMLVEAGLTLALTDPAQLPGEPGVLTPAAGLGLPYAGRLCASGTVVAVESLSAAPK